MIRATTRLAVLCGLMLAPLSATGDTLELLSDVTWELPEAGWFGGFSGFEITDDGAEFVAVTDMSILVKGRLQRDDQGRITAAFADTAQKVVSDQGRYIRDVNGQTEGLALAADGRLWVTTEGYAALNYIRPGTHDVVWVNGPPAFAKVQTNSGLEALALDPHGRPIMLPERSGKMDRPFPVWRLEKDGSWTQPYEIARIGDFRPVGADLGPDGRLYLLERAYPNIPIFTSRIRSFAFTEDGLGDERTIWESRLGQYDNLEGLSAWQDREGGIRLTLISDDNFMFFEKTQIVEFRLKPGA